MVSRVVRRSALTSAVLVVMLDVVMLDVVTLCDALNDTPIADDTNICEVDTLSEATRVDTTRSAGIVASGG